VSIARPGNAQGDVDVAWNGHVFLVVWQETPAAGGPSEIYAARVNADGHVLDPNGILLSLSEDSHARPAVAGGDGRFMVVWEERPEGTYTDLGAAIVRGSGQVKRRWFLSLVDNGQSNPDVAWGNQMFLATWEDEPDPEDQDIYGARVLPSGLTLDGCSTDACSNPDDPGIAIGLSVGTDQLTPATAWTGKMFALMWADEDTATPGDIRTNAVAVNAGTFFEEGFVVSDAAGSQTDPDVARNHDLLLTAWTDTRSGTTSDVFFTRIEPDPFDYSPTPLPANGTALSAGAGMQQEVAVARRGGGFIAVWTDDRNGTNDIIAARISAGGVVRTPVGVPVATGPRNQRAAAIADGGSVQLVAYQRDVPASPFNGLDRVFLRIVS
jgi:hypothetical protein